MEKNLVREIQECLRGERTLFYYFPDQYALYLVSRLIAGKNRLAIRDIRNGHYASLLNRSVLKTVIKGCGDGYIYKRQLEQSWCSNAEPFVLTLGEWGEKEAWTWDQVSRPGTNLVLQLNASNKWARLAETMLQEPANNYSGYGHPISETRSMTLAWARLDIDFFTDEVLIEEIQSDSIRDFSMLHQRAVLNLSKGQSFISSYGVKLDAKRVLEVSQVYVNTFRKIWHEAMLTAAIRFTFEELGVSKLFYHSFETGNKMKNLDYCYPPRSLYSDLPKKFCFRHCGEAPEFLRKEKKLKRKLRKLNGGTWFYMAA